jgi:hypothetical protein
MCYALFLSTDSSEDLTRYNSDLISFQLPDPVDQRHLSTLKNREKWYVGSISGCSCTFRHLLSVELGFGEPVDWYGEEENELRATAELYRTIAGLVSRGHEVDCLDIWEGARKSDIQAKVVNLSEVAEKAFRLFENYHFVFQ